MRRRKEKEDEEEEEEEEILQILFAERTLFNASLAATPTRSEALH